MSGQRLTGQEGLYERAPTQQPLMAERVSGNYEQAAIPTANPPPQALPYAVLISTNTPRGDQGQYSYTPRRIICQNCGYEVVTSVDRTSGPGTHIIAGLLCLVGLWPCCLFPYCMDDCKDAQHYCPNCHQLVGARRFM